MRKLVDDALRALGIAQGVWFVGATVGGGAAVAGLIGGILPEYVSLPWWSVALTMFGSFLLTASIIAAVWTRLRPASSALNRVIDDGLRLRKRLLDDPATEPSEPDRQAWQVRVDDWLAETRALVRELAPHRLGAFSLDVIISDNSAPEAPRWKQNMLTEIDISIERLSVLRASI